MMHSIALGESIYCNQDEDFVVVDIEANSERHPTTSARESSVCKVQDEEDDHDDASYDYCDDVFERVTSVSSRAVFVKDIETHHELSPIDSLENEEEEVLLELSFMSDSLLKEITEVVRDESCDIESILDSPLVVSSSTDSAGSDSVVLSESITISKLSTQKDLPIVRSSSALEKQSFKRSPTESGDHLTMATCAPDSVKGALEQSNETGQLMNPPSVTIPVSVERIPIRNCRLTSKKRRKQRRTATKAAAAAVAAASLEQKLGMTTPSSPQIRRGPHRCKKQHFSQPKRKQRTLY